MIVTNCGKIKGIISTNDPNVEIFKGIRYAKAMRFCRPKIVEKWDGIYDATTYKDCSYQQRSFEDESTNPSKKFYYNEFRKDEVYTYSEDCLYLNIFKPIEAKMCPVMIYIHGGSFVGGCGFEKHFQPEKWCRKGVIVVTINYRLGPFGFLTTKDIENEDYKGNWAIHDIYAAIKWVENNIDSFGGDKLNITLAGQSAGAIALTTLILSNKINNKCILLSCGGVDKIMNPGQFSLKKAQKFWDKVLKDLNVKNVEEINKLSAQDIYSSFRKLSNKHPLASFFACSPYVDDYFLQDKGTKMFNKLENTNTPCMLSSTSEDIIPPILFNMNKKWAKKFKNSYRAFFSRQLPGDNKGAFHSSDLWYFFGSLKHCWRPFEEEDFVLSDMMINYYSNFVKTSNPNGDGLLYWPKDCESNNKLMVFDKKIELKKINNSKIFLSLFKRHGKGEN